MSEDDFDITFQGDTIPKTVVNQRYHEDGETTWNMMRFVDIDDWRCGIGASASYTDAMRESNRKECADLLRVARTLLAKQMRESYPEVVVNPQNIVYH